MIIPFTKPWAPHHPTENLVPRVAIKGDMFCTSAAGVKGQDRTEGPFLILSTFKQLLMVDTPMCLENPHFNVIYSSVLVLYIFPYYFPFFISSFFCHWQKHIPTFPNPKKTVKQSFTGPQLIISISSTYFWHYLPPKPNLRKTNTSTYSCLLLTTIK